MQLIRRTAGVKPKLLTEWNYRGKQSTCFARKAALFVSELEEKMARPIRIEYPGAWYHVTCRGNERKVIFSDDLDRAKFLEILAKRAELYAIEQPC